MKNSQTTHGFSSPLKSEPGIKTTIPRRIVKSQLSNQYGEAGAILIMAMIFLVAVSIAILAISNWTENSLNNTLKFQNISKEAYAADGVTQLAVRASRYTYLSGLNNANPVNGYLCPGTSNPVAINGYAIQDWCSTVFPDPELNFGAVTRQITITACLMSSTSSMLSSNCASTNQALLTAVIQIDDVPQNETTDPCTSISDEYACGANMAILSWTAT
jgi:hypothetical protein